jgi:hypothetical protein
MQIMNSWGSSDRQSRRELEETIESQKDQISRYETRLRDVVRAYKGIIKEKEALENSLTVINDANIAGEESDVETENNSETTGNEEEDPAGSETGGHKTEDSENPNQKNSKPENAEPESGKEPPKASSSLASSGVEAEVAAIPKSSKNRPKIVDKNSKKIATLTASLATVYSEKSRLESAFQEDKKQLRSELNEKDKLLTSLKSELKSTQDTLRLQVDEAKSKLIIERHNREKESNDNALMLRELQKLITDERTAKEKFEADLDQTKDSLKVLQLAGTFNAEYEKRVRQLESEVKTKDALIEDLQTRVNTTPPELIKLKVIFMVF